MANSPPKWLDATSRDAFRGKWAFHQLLNIDTALPCLFTELNIYLDVYSIAYSNYQ